MTMCRKPQTVDDYSVNASEHEHLHLVVSGGGHTNGGEHDVDAILSGGGQEG